MEIHSDYIIYFINFVIYIVLCYIIIKQAKKDIFAPKEKEKEPVLCPIHEYPLDDTQRYEGHIRRTWIVIGYTQWHLKLELIIYLLAVSVSMSVKKQQGP